MLSLRLLYKRKNQNTVAQNRVKAMTVNELEFSWGTETSHGKMTWYF